jgi:hypothetical protein
MHVFGVLSQILVQFWLTRHHSEHPILHEFGVGIPPNMSSAHLPAAAMRLWPVSRAANIAALTSCFSISVSASEYGFDEPGLSQ